MRKLSNFIVVSTCGVTILMVGLLYVLVMFGYEHVVVQRSEKHARTLTDLTFNSLYQIMRKGGSRNDVADLLEGNKKLFSGTNMNVVVYRNPSLHRQEAAQAPVDQQVAMVLNNGVATHYHAGSVVRYIYPLTASSECLGCHANSRPGETLGVIDSRIDIGKELAETRRNLLIFLAIIAVLPLSLSFMLARRFSLRVHHSMASLQHQIEGVNRISDLKQIELQDLRLGFVEFEEMFAEMNKIIAKLRGIAIDKDVLEFEVKLLERFIITSEIVRDWKAHVSHILIEINSIMETYFFFSLFMIDEETYDLEVFWRNTPSDQTKEYFEAVIREKIANSPRFRQVGQVNIIHNVALPLAALPPLRVEDIELQTKALFLEAPRIGGIVGIGVISALEKFPARALVIESILATLLNVVGSVKAIYRYTKELEFYSTRDPLTNLFNQRVFWEILGNEVERADRAGNQFALIHIDIDNFKVINDSYGHAFGDHLLQGVSEIIKSVLRRGDVSARYGGDEFAVILPDTEGQQAYLVAQRIREDLAAVSFSPPEGGSLKLSVSIGISLFPTHAKSSKELFMMADNMRAKAKQDGKDQIAIPTEEDLAEVYRSISEKNIMIMRAIEERLLVPYFQPIVNTSTGKVEAHEVLMRIALPDKTVRAEEFVSIAESMGMISRMDYILMEKVFQKAHSSGYKGLLFINISPKALILNEFIPNVRRLTKEYSIDPASVVFEITERETVKNMTLLERFVLDLKLENYKFAIDDFGAGFSSYQYLKRFPVDFIKVEGEFVRGMAAAGGVDLAIVKSIATLAHGLGIKTVGEYVENEEILGIIRDINLTFAQGYHVGLPAADLTVDPSEG